VAWGYVYVKVNQSTHMYPYFLIFQKTGVSAPQRFYANPPSPERRAGGNTPGRPSPLAVKLFPPQAFGQESKD
jgi:hypothetical protein